jgi:hypothetical protein
MAILKKGILGHFEGQLDGIVYYTRMGKNVGRKQTNSTKPRSPSQLASQQGLKVTSHFLSQVREFTNLGFKTDHFKKGGTAYNRATSAVKLNGLTGVYPDLSLDFEHLKLSVGNLPIAEGVSLAIVPTGVAFSWAIDPTQHWPQTTDQAMLLVYFPGDNIALYVLYGSERASGQSILPINSPMLGKTMHFYLSFISADRANVSDSMYAGALNL